MYSIVMVCLSTFLLATSAHAGIIQQFPGGFITFLANRWGINNTSYRTNLPYGMHRLPPAQEYYLDHWLKYRPGWLDGEGGKFMGLGGGDATTGCDRIVPDGWSVRYMWDPMRMYLYHQDRTNDCGDSEGFQPSKLEVDRWYRLTQRVKVNTPNQRNGVVEVWVDGKRVYSRSNLRLRGAVGSSTALVDRFIVHPIRGGADASWAVPRDTTVDFSTFYILDCLPHFGGGPTSTPQCGNGQGLPETETPATVMTRPPRNLRIVQ